MTDGEQSVPQGPAPAGRPFGQSTLHDTDAAEREPDDLISKYPLVYKHCSNFAAKLIQRGWSRYMMRVVFKYLLSCSREFEELLTPRDLSRIYPEFLESSDPRMSARLQIRLQGVSFPPCLVCRILAESAPSVDGGKHAPKWIPLYHAGKAVPVDRKALVHLFLESVHGLRDNQASMLRTKPGPLK